MDRSPEVRRVNAYCVRIERLVVRVPWVSIRTHSLFDAVRQPAKQTFFLIIIASQIITKTHDRLNTLHAAKSLTSAKNNSSSVVHVNAHLAGAGC